MNPPIRVLVRFSRQINLFVGAPGKNWSKRFTMLEIDGHCYSQEGVICIPANDLNPESVIDYLKVVFYAKKLQNYSVVYK